MQERLARLRGAPPWTLFAGDDWTDEHAFEALGDGGISVCVGDRPSVARFRLAAPATVELLLAALASAPRLSTEAVSRQV
jgi:trehalose-6-phosphatase